MNCYRCDQIRKAVKEYFYRSEVQVQHFPEGYHLAIVGSDQCTSTLIRDCDDLDNIVSSLIDYGRDESRYSPHFDHIRQNFFEGID